MNIPSVSVLWYGGCCGGIPHFFVNQDLCCENGFDPPPTRQLMSDMNMTNSDHASDQSLTEEAYARSIGAATIPTFPHFPDEWDYLTYEEKYRKQKWQKCVLQIGSPGWEQYQIDFALAEAAYNRYDRWKTDYRAWKKKQMYKNAAGNNQHQLGPREFTFTYTDSWFENDGEAQEAMRCAIEKLTRYYKDEIIEFHAIGEYTRAGRSHVHGWYNLTGGRKITDKNFKRAWRYWNPKRKLGKGFEGGHHQTISRVSDFHGYTEKHLEEAWLVIDINNANDEEEVESATPASSGDGTQGS